MKKLWKDWEYLKAILPKAPSQGMRMEEMRWIEKLHG